jgi:hypothetical protein
MKKIIFLILILLFGVISLDARDMSGRFGLGLGWSEIGDGMGSLIRAPDHVFTKIGLSSRLMFKPMLGINIEGYDGETTTTISVEVAINYIFLSHAKSNLYFGGGLSYSSISPPVGNGVTELGLIFDVGLEHFVSSYFSLDLSMRSQFVKSSMGGYSTSELYIGNQSVNFGLVWYY